MRKFFFALVATLLTATQLLAVPATPYPVKVTQPDGRELTVRLNGDEFTTSTPQKMATPL